MPIPGCAGFATLSISRRPEPAGRTGSIRCRLSQEVRIAMAERKMMKRGMILAGLAAVLLAAPLRSAPAAPTRARPSFDGNWSVLIVTDAGTCDRAYRYALRIANGNVYYNDPSFNVSGHVDPRGRVSVSVSAGGQHANGTGELSGDYGQGQWSGRSATSACSGHWEAERRG